jgi:hypothetical protein
MINLNLNLSELSTLSKCMSIICILSLSTGSFGCAGSQLTPQEEERYNTLLTEQKEISNERAQLAQQVKRDFTESGRIEKVKKAIAKRALNCGFSIQNQSFGPLPFKKKKGKKAKFGANGRASRSGCTAHSLKVK